MARSQAIDCLRRGWFWLWLSAVTLFFLWAAAYNLANYRPLSEDDAWIMSVSTKIAREGVMGSDLYTGFANTDRHYFIALPVHSLLQAATFKVAGVGVAQARFVSLAAAVTLIWLVSWLAYRWHGPVAGVAAALLLLFWRSELAAAYPGLPLLGLARVGRYDLTAVAWMWLAIALLDQLLRRPGRLLALTVGVCCGLAALTQFFGAFVIPLAAVAWLWSRGRRALRDPLSYWLLAGLLLILLPYGLYIAQDWPALVAQYATTKPARTDFGRAGFFLDNLWRESARFRPLWDRPLPYLAAPYGFDNPLSPWLLLGAGPAGLLLWWRGRPGQESGDAWGRRLLALSLLLFGGLLALVEQTKAPVYGIVLVPSICLLLAQAAGWLAQAARRRPLLWLPLAALAFLVVNEGRVAYLVEREVAAAQSDYLAVGQEMERWLAPGATVLGSDRWWWALPGHPYLSLNSLWLRGRWAEQNGQRPPTFAEMAEAAEADYVLVNNNVRGNITGFSAAMQAQFWDYLAGCTRPVADWEDRSYGRIEIVEVRPVCR